MSFNMTGTKTGAAITGLTSPTYLLVADNPPANNGRQSYVSTLGGTQSGVTTHSASDVFTVSVFKPTMYRFLNFVTSAVSRKAPKNTWKVLTRKGVTFLTGQPKDTLVISTLIDLPSGVELVDSINFKAALSCHIGFLTQSPDDVANSVLTNSI